MQFLLRLLQKSILIENHIASFTYASQATLDQPKLLSSGSSATTAFIYTVVHRETFYLYLNTVGVLVYNSRR